MDARTTAILGVLSVIAGFWAVSGPAYFPSLSDKTGGSSPPIVLITVESLNAEHAGLCYGYNRNTTPHLCRVAADGILFEQAYSTGTRTPIAVPSLLTGLPPNSVGFNHFASEDRKLRINDSVLTIPEILESSGYNTFGIQGSRGGFYREVENWSRPQEYGREDAFHRIITAGTRPVFIWRFINPPHYPLAPPQEYRLWGNITTPRSTLRDSQTRDRQGFYQDMGAESLINLYDAEVRAADASIGRILQALKDAERYDEALIIITADHGEALYNPRGGKELVFSHPLPPHEEVSHVPLVVKLPNQKYAGSRVSSIVRHVDILPTILDVTNLTTKQSLIGESLLSAVIMNRSTGPAITASRVNRWWTIRNGTHTLILENVDEACLGTGLIGGTQLYDRRSDPNEWNDTSAQHPQMVKMLAETLCEVYQTGEHETYPPERLDLNAELRQQLENLGYLPQK